MVHSTDSKALTIALVRGLTIATITVSAAILSGCSLIDQFTNQTNPAGAGQGSPSPEAANAFSIKVGDCLNDGEASGTVTTVPIVPCADPHDSEAYASIMVEGDEFPGDTAIHEQADTGCAAEFADFVGVPAEGSALRFSYYFPTLDSWTGGDREILCEVYEPDTQTTGSLRGAAR